jgi:hypothetical protein
MDETSPTAGTTLGALSDADITTVMPAGGVAIRASQADTDGTDTSDGTDGDATDGHDGDAHDSDGTDSKDTDGTDSKDTDGTDSES